MQDPLAERILSGDVHDGETVEITAGTDRLLFTGIRGESRAA